jgi:two-component system cell cycle response regulator CtrA
MMRALLIEDDAATARSIELALALEEIMCDTVELGEEGIEISKLYDYDFMILDRILPDMDGHEVLVRIRKAQIKIPVLILSGISSVESKVKGLGFGADDYLTKPFNRSELIARLQAIVRRSKGHPDSIVKVGKLELNLDNRTVTVADKPVHLTTKEYGILELLVLRSGSVLTKEMFLNHLYGAVDTEPEGKIIDVFICKLRRKLYEASPDHLIETVWGQGYTLKKPKGEENNNGNTDNISQISANSSIPSEV